MDLQEDIGWNSYIQGFWHNKWRLVQDRPAVTSQQAEHYGVIGILILCLAIQVSSPFVLSSSIPVWIDNEQTQS